MDAGDMKAAEWGQNSGPSGPDRFFLNNAHLNLDLLCVHCQNSEAEKQGSENRQARRHDCCLTSLESNSAQLSSHSAAVFGEQNATPIHPHVQNPSVPVRTSRQDPDVRGNPAPSYAGCQKGISHLHRPLVEFKTIACLSNRQMTWQTIIEVSPQHAPIG